MQDKKLKAQQKMKYNFFEQLDKVKKDPYYTLPEDINFPIIEYLERIGCGCAIRKLKYYQDHVKYGTIEIVNDKIPNAKITIHVDCGMVGERKEWKMSKDGDWSVIEYSTVKNPNLTKEKKFNFANKKGKR